MTPPVDPWGIQQGFHDVDGQWHQATHGTLQALRTAMGAGDRAAAPPEPWTVWVVGVGEAAPLIGPVELELEDGTALRAESRLPPDLPIGYHTLHQLWEGRRGGEPTRLIVSPRRCAPPPQGRTWGLSTQIYGARSRQSWGVGDLADLRTLGAWLRERGAGSLLVNPLDAGSPVTPRDPSPYFPTSRLFRDPLYLRVDEIPGAELVDLDDLRTAGLAANEGEWLDKDAAYARVITACERIFAATSDAGRDERFRAFREREDPELTAFATFCALAEQHGTGWRSWPADVRHPDAAGVAEFVAAHADRIGFHAWLQWLLDEQLAAAGRAIPLMRDLPVGFDPNGADAWMWQDHLADGVTVGAPPDPLGPRGQDWLLPAFVPWKLRQSGYEPIARTLRAAFRHAGALRIDHVLGLFRLFWIPAGGTPADGAYVRYPAADLLDVLAVESHRAGAFVVGEDLGTVEAGVREELAAREVLRYQVMWFEDAPPDQWADLALASATTHDLPTIAGLWSGADADALRALGHDPDEEWVEQTVRRIRRLAGLPDDASPEEAVEAVHRLLGGAAARVVVGQLEDAVAMTERINVPGTTTAKRRNWSRPLPRPLEDLLEDPGVTARVRALTAGR